MTDRADLVQRLRAPWTHYDGKREILCNEAADQIERLTRENEELRAADRDHLAAKAGMEKRLTDHALSISDETREACAKILDEVAWLLSVQSDNAKSAGDDPSMYRINTAWHAITNAAAAIRASAQKASTLTNGETNA